MKLAACCAAFACSYCCYYKVVLFLSKDRICVQGVKELTARYYAMEKIKFQSISPSSAMEMVAGELTTD